MFYDHFSARSLLAKLGRMFESNPIAGIVYVLEGRISLWAGLNSNQFMRCRNQI